MALSGSAMPGAAHPGGKLPAGSGPTTLGTTHSVDYVGAFDTEANERDDVAHIPSVERRRQIIEVAARVIGREGVANATTRRIGAEAKANIGTLHYTFGSKDDLLDATFAYCWDLASELIEGALDVGADPRGTVSEMLTRYVELAIADPDIVAAQYQLLNWAVANEGRKEQAVALMRQLDELVIDALSRAGWPENLSIDHVGMGRMLGSMLDGILLRFVVERSEQQLRDDLATALALVGAVYAGGTKIGK